MSTDLPKTYDPAAVESQAYDVWIKERAFAADPKAPGKPYSIVIPPPNVTGALHLGHAINNTLQDILTRQHRMMGDNALWVPGIDHAGIATQAVVEKQLKEQEGMDRHKLGREKLVERIWQWKEQYGNRILQQLKRLGCSCDWDRTRFTLDEQCARAVRETFFKLFKDGLIYRGKRLVNWDIHLQTSISDDEIYHETVKTSLWHIKYPIEGTDKSMVVATTRPETMLGDTAVAVHSEDPRWNWAIGKSVKLPLVNRLIPIIADDILVDPKFGTGCVKVTPAHDPNDYAVWQRHQGKPDQIDLINILEPNGTLNENAGPYKGMKRDAARKKVVEDLGDLLLKEEPYETQVGHSDRSKTPVEPYLSDQWFVKMAPLAEPALQVVRDGTIKFFPERHAQQYLSWLGEKRDWPISRQLWWGHRIPVWAKEVDASTQFMEAAANDRPHQVLNSKFGDLLKENNRVWGFARGLVNTETGKAYHTICMRESDPEIEALLVKRGYVQDPDVLDTWFSSALWPHSTLGWPEQTDALKKWYPTSVLLTGRDIITLWVARMVMTGLYNMKAIPFAHVAINPTILDEFGKRMSKTAGNGVDPVDIIETHGADALRFTLTHMATETQDTRLSVKIVCPQCQTLIANPESYKVATVKCPKCSATVTRPLGTQKGTPEAPLGRMTSEKFDLGRNFCNKLWNAARFVLSSLSAVPASAGTDPATPSLADRWIISRFNHTVAEVNDALNHYRFDQYARLCYDFFWRDFCDWYVEASKPAIKDPNRAAQTGNILATVLDGALRLMHPVIPFITETIWWRLNEVRPKRGIPGQIECPASPRLIKAAWPAAGAIAEDVEQAFTKLQEIIQAIRNARNEYKVDLKKSVAVSAVCSGDLAKTFESNREMIELMTTCTVKIVPQPITGATRLAAGGCELFIEGLVDTGTSQQRNAKREEELNKLISTLEGRMSNEGYMAKAPPKLVEQTKQQLAEAKAELAKLRG